ncbi:hypothetical protein IV500_01115 [Paeniglutamicibacter antarcticus]|uniref:Uncharacterized protein n=1 Tax=Arthrobacter terrae TaxID=2935737 RepID=A0A931CGA3_9MICC|nr:hypothetical protein [Arthrobacter terrae]MBG0738037.1 hypothetical protein [Arthrobacter terrae]
MKHPFARSTSSPPYQTGQTRQTTTGLPPLWFWLSICAALFAAAGSITGLVMPERIYGKESATLFDAVIAQDLVNLFVVVPLTVVLGVLAFRGSLRSWLCLLGFLVFTAYNYAIYAFSIHFGPLFLVWVAVLGLAVFAFAGALSAVNTTDVKALFTGTAGRLPAWFLLFTAVLFAVLWFSEIVPDLLTGRPSASAVSWNIPTNPVHVLDLAIFLPGVFASGLALLRDHWLGYATAAGALIFLGLTALPIFLTPFVAQAHDRATGWTILAPMGVIIVAVSVILWLWLRPKRVWAPSTAAESS